VHSLSIGERDVVVVRHGPTEWSTNGRHTGCRTDLPLLPEGERVAETLRSRLADHEFGLVLTSPLRRALDTCRLAGLRTDAAGCEVDGDLAEWDYGDYEGLTTPEIRELTGQPDWDVWTARQMPNGESLDEVAVRVDRVLQRVATTGGPVAIFGHGHCLRILIARWLALPPDGGRLFALETGTVNLLGYERERRVLRVLNS
jgi:probable phosphoglycerate mutase